MIKSFDEETLQYLINHIVLPIMLPDQEDEKNESSFLSLITEVLNELKQEQIDSNEFSEVLNMFNRWTSIQGNSIIMDEKLLLKSINNLEKNQILPIYVRCQNACLIIHIVSNNEAIVSFFQASFQNHEVMSTPYDIESSYPSKSIYVDNLEIIKSESFAELLTDLINDEFEVAMPKTSKSGSEHIEIRNVAYPLLISEYLFSILVSNSNVNEQMLPKKIKKKNRDDVLFKNALKPFRRSGSY